MVSALIVETAKLLPKGQITIPKELRENLGVDSGDRLLLVWDGEKVLMANPVTYAIRAFGDELAGQAASAGFADEDDVAGYITDLRRARGAA
jgi:AbrB family looped-hinge helix DNA binding protein